MNYLNLCLTIHTPRINFITLLLSCRVAVAVYSFENLFFFYWHRIYIIKTLTAVTCSHNFCFTVVEHISIHVEAKIVSAQSIKTAPDKKKQLVFIFVVGTKRQIICADVLSCRMLRISGIKKLSIFHLESKISSVITQRTTWYDSFLPHCS